MNSILYLDNAATTPVDPRGSDDFGYMFIQIPVVNGRDMNDLRVFSRDGEEWIRFGSSRYRPAESLPPLSEGETQIRIGEDAAAQWRSVPADMRLETTGNDAWRAYTPDGHAIDAAAASGVAWLARACWLIWRTRATSRSRVSPGSAAASSGLACAASS